MYNDGILYHGGMFWAVFGMTWVFACAAVLIVVWHLRSKRRLEKMTLVHQERMKAIEKGVPLPEFPELSEEAKMQQFDRIFTPPKLNPRWPIGVGALVVMGGLGYLVAAKLSNDPDLAKTWSMGLIPMFIGFGLVLYYFLTRQADQR